MAAMGVQKNVEASIKSAQQKIKEAARASFKKHYPDADAETLKKLDAVFDTTPGFTFESISEPLVAAYQKNLSAADVQAGVDFYGSDAGKRLLAKLPAIQRETNDNAGKLLEKLLSEYGQDLERRLTAFQAELPQKPVEESKPGELPDAPTPKSK